MRRALRLCAALALTAACATAQDGFRPARDAGIAGFVEDGVGCVRWPAPRPATGTQVLLATTLPDPELRVARVLAPSASRCPASDPALGDSLVGISVEGDEPPSRGSYWFALRVHQNALAIVGAGIAGELFPDGVLESLRICTSSEGLWFSIWTGEPLSGRRRWAEYVPLFYDVDPSCDERDFDEPPSGGVRRR